MPFFVQEREIELQQRHQSLGERFANGSQEGRVANLVETLGRQKDVVVLVIVLGGAGDEKGDELRDEPGIDHPGDQAEHLVPGLVGPVGAEDLIP